MEILQPSEAIIKLVPLLWDLAKARRPSEKEVLGQKICQLVRVQLEERDKVISVLQGAIDYLKAGRG